jgi:biopolymer transport protein ExbB
MLRLRRSRVIPYEFRSRFVERLEGGKLDRGKALDYCELNSSPAARVALAAVKRWGRPVTDLERAVSLAHRAEAGLLRKNVGTLRRLAALSPLLGLLGTLHSVSRTLAALGGAAESAAWGPALASALGPLTAGIAVAVIGLVAYDGLTLRAEALISDLDLIGAQTIDAVTMALPTGPPRTPHQLRLEIPPAVSPRPSEGSGDFA